MALVKWRVEAIPLERVRITVAVLRLGSGNWQLDIGLLTSTARHCWSCQSPLKATLYFPRRPVTASPTTSDFNVTLSLHTIFTFAPKMISKHN
ncbi:hypothetical protein F2Q69_00045116 [Brassica cretica]|uniref:Uncharacterized protein n=1 Tax=Brassica cretica TaxID=69181 RepID=A0A8S9NE75_BRACR|nr:hypothetical protein F2Q69_00045116 [Brassica cretica]